MTTWSRLIRFVDVENVTRFGQPILKDEDLTVDQLLDLGVLEANVIEGDVLSEEAIVTDKVVQVKHLLAPLEVAQVPIIKCIGLNYKAHIAEGGRSPPPFPSVFIKPSHSLADAYEDLPIPPVAHDTLDYEVELAIIIGKTGKDIPVDQVGDYIAGFTASNDISNRKWQIDPNFAGGAAQWCFSKGFDKFAPIGPAIVSTKILGTRPCLDLKTKVNGELRQDSNSADMLFHVPELVAFASQGTTLEKGTVILTGTPAGVAMGMKDPLYLKNGDLMEVSISQIGKIANRIVFQ
ncbi:hypothetical protein DM01DRAFT_1361613 [Hesseltinella vesiculosa]|uniref:Fumarylacetoacetase-like C-terminal domain-containing protein n=1 Tax=Hesseltinella vesiculosa TaxID=101127 RepID=A0A1X2GT46_9FUNG|nr:hypothetical protein DM01DRAFT_1361613 [Hesseltinella vesiculosa]